MNISTFSVSSDNLSKNPFEFSNKFFEEMFSESDQNEKDIQFKCWIIFALSNLILNTSQVLIETTVINKLLNNNNFKLIRSLLLSDLIHASILSKLDNQYLNASKLSIISFLTAFDQNDKVENK